MTEHSAFRRSHHHGGVHRNLHCERVTHTEGTRGRDDSVVRGVNSGSGVGQRTAVDIHRISAVGTVKSLSTTDVAVGSHRPSIGSGEIIRPRGGGIRRERGAAADVVGDNGRNSVFRVWCVQGHLHRQGSFTVRSRILHFHRIGVRDHTTVRLCIDRR